MNRRSKSQQRQQRVRGRIPVGLIGVGPLWEHRYRPAVERLKARISVTCVFDAVLARAQQVAGEIGADVASGLRSLYERPDVQAVLVLDPAWYGLVPAELACEYHRPAFLAGSLGDDLVALQGLHQLAVDRETLLMTEFSRRYTPATTRLRELMATKLGQAVRVQIQAHLPPDGDDCALLPGQACERDFLAGLFDWCQYVTGRTPVSVAASLPPAAKSGDPQPGARQIEIGFRPDSQGNPGCLARIQLQAPRENSAAIPQHEVHCEKGVATIGEVASIAWKNGTYSTQEFEQLTADRSDAEVMLDQFFRRVVGGLIPVPDVHDVCRALFLVQSAERQFETPATS
ncbi:hypothetical protein GC163_15265 [bacterium]|nr:hypothetical protein [bacterium]